MSLFLKYISFLLLTIFPFVNVIAEDFNLDVKLVSKNKDGKEISQDSSNYEIYIPELLLREHPNDSGIANFKIPNGALKSGERIKFEVNKPGWHIAYPPNGLAYLPKEEKHSLKIVLEIDQFNFVKYNPEEKYIYTVQALVTANETVARQKAKKLAQENPKHRAFVERYLASNMPENGFIYKVKIGEFTGKKAKEDAEKLSYKLDSKYREINGFFVTLKDHK